MAFVHKLESDTLSENPIYFRANGQGGVDFFSTGTNDGRYMTINPGGGHWEHSIHGSLPAANGLELDQDGRVLIHKD